MRMLVEVGIEDEDPLRELAIHDHRSVRQQSNYLLHLKIQEAFAQLQETTQPTAATTDAVAA